MNKDLNFSIAWYPSVHSFYGEYMNARINIMKDLKEQSGHDQGEINN